MTDGASLSGSGTVTDILDCFRSAGIDCGFNLGIRDIQAAADNFCLQAIARHLGGNGRS